MSSNTSATQRDLVSATSSKDNPLLTDFGLCPERFNELTDVRVTKIAQNLDLSSKRSTTVVCGCVDRAILVSVRVKRSGKFVGPNHLYRDELTSASGEGFVYRGKGPSTKFVANVVISPEAITSRTRGRESEYETYLISWG